MSLTDPVLHLTEGADYALRCTFVDGDGTPVDMSEYEFLIEIRQTRLTDVLVSFESNYAGASAGEVDFLLEEVPALPQEDIFVVNATLNGRDWPMFSGRVEANPNWAQAATETLVVTLLGEEAIQIEIGPVAGPQGPKGNPGDPGVDGADGPPGPSAYDLAVEQGFVGTESEWLLSLHGDTGPAGADGPEGPPGTTDHTQLANLDTANQHPIAVVTGLQAALDALTSALNDYVLLTSVGAASGVAPLDASGLILDSYLPASIARDSEITSAVSTAVAALVGTAGVTLDTLGEIATALGNDPNFATTITTLVGQKVAKSLYDAQSILVAVTDDTPTALTVGEQTIVGRITGGNVTALTPTQIKTMLAIAESDVTGLVTDLAAKVAKSTYDANTILKADADDTPTALTVGEQTLVGRITGGVITALTPSQVRSLLGLVIGTDVQAYNATLTSWAAKTVPSGTVVGTSDTQTLTNKRRVARVTTITSSATPTINTDNCDCVTITALAAAITSMTTNLSGTPNNFDSLLFRIKDNGTARAITWGASFEAKGVALPTTTVISKVLTVLFIWDSVTSKWGCVASAQEA